MKQTAVLQAAKIVNGRLQGFIYDDIKARFANATFVQTSLIVTDANPYFTTASGSVYYVESWL